MSKARVDTTPHKGGLTDNPFAALKKTSSETAPGEKGAPATPAAKTALPFCMTRTKKGGYPLVVERRPGNKTVTILRNITGDTSALLTILKKQCGAGGTSRAGEIELQGDHQQWLQAWLKQNQ